MEGSQLQEQAVQKIFYSVSDVKDFTNCVKYACHECRKALSSLDNKHAHAYSGGKKDLSVLNGNKEVLSDTNPNMHSADVLGRNIRCEACHKTFSSVLALRKHTQYFQGSKFKCDFCSAAFCTKCYLNQHMYKHPDKEYTCEDCSMTFSRLVYYERHLCNRSVCNTFQCNVQAQPMTYICGSCDGIFPSEEAVNVYKKAHEGNYICYKCNCKFPTLEVLVAHKKVHESNYICDKYNSRFAAEKQLVPYKKVNKENYISDKYNYRFSTENQPITHKKVTKDNHVDNKYSSMEKYACNMCESKFFSEYILKNHRCIPTEETIDVCVDCPKKFYRQSLAHRPCFRTTEVCTTSNHFQNSVEKKTNVDVRFLRHIYRKKPFSCGLCRKSFTYYCSYKIHILKHVTKWQSTAKSIKKHPCLRCHKLFYLKSTARKHFFAHTRINATLRRIRSWKSSFPPSFLSYAKACMSSMHSSSSNKF